MFGTPSVIMMLSFNGITPMEYALCVMNIRLKSDVLTTCMRQICEELAHQLSNTAKINTDLFILLICILDVNECLFPGAFHCLANRQCVDAIGTYQCEACFYGYDGPHCDQPINECALRKCQNNATCIDGPFPHDYYCNCVQGFEGNTYLFFVYQ